MKGMLNFVKDLSFIYRDDHAVPTLKSILDYIDYACWTIFAFCSKTSLAMVYNP